MLVTSTWLPSAIVTPKKFMKMPFFHTNEVSKALTLNNTGDYSYFEKGVNKAVPEFCDEWNYKCQFKFDLKPHMVPPSKLVQQVLT